MSKFDREINRYGTSCAKYDSNREFGKPDGLIPLWVADMDFAVAEPVKKSLEKCINHGIFGYGHVEDDYYSVLNNWFENNYGFEIKKEWVVHTPGVVFALAAAINTFTNPGDSVLINNPVYYPFSNLIKTNDRKIVNSPLIRENQIYEFNFEDFERKIVENDVKLYLLCSPHNPVGRVWTREELMTIGDICLKHDVIIVSDEIHCDFTWESNKHIVFSSLGEKYADKSIICTSPSKSFNLAGLQVSNIIIKNKEIRKKFRNKVFSSGFSSLNVLGAAACKVAYSDGSKWLQEVKDYIYENILFTEDFIRQNIKEVEFIRPQGTYLLWLDFNHSGIKSDEIDSFITNKAGLWLDDGEIFGEEGKGFQRINAACPRSTLKKALQQLCNALESFS